MKNYSREELMEIFKEVIKEFEQRIGEPVQISEDETNIILDVVVKIIDLPNESWTSIAQLINYNPEILPISPLVQGKINNYVNRICKKIEIKLIDDESLGGLAFMQKFKKI